MTRVLRKSGQSSLKVRPQNPHPGILDVLAGLDHHLHCFFYDKPAHIIVDGACPPESPRDDTPRIGPLNVR